MFCYKCGNELIDNQKFCSYCGAKNEIRNDSTSSSNEILNDPQYQQLNTVFNRDVLNNYLYNIRLLEISKNKLCNKKKSIENHINSLGIKRVNYQNKIYPEMALYVWGFVAIVVVIELIVGRIATWDFFGASWSVFIGLIVAAIIFGVLVSLFDIFNELSEKNAHNQEAKNDNIRVENELKEKDRLQSLLPGINNEIDKIEALLLDAYSINIIPSKFRNIYAAYFLYDFISTSTASLNEALLHCDLDTIQEKLDTVIQQQEEIIMELAYQNALDEKIVRQNEQILGHAIQTENNTALAAQYEKIAANNTGVVAAIQMSEYLKP